MTASQDAFPSISDDFAVGGENEADLPSFPNNNDDLKPISFGKDFAKLTARDNVTPQFEMPAAQPIV